MEGDCSEAGKNLVERAEECRRADVQVRLEWNVGRADAANLLRTSNWFIPSQEWSDQGGAVPTSILKCQKVVV